MINKQGLNGDLNSEHKKTTNRSTISLFAIFFLGPVVQSIVSLTSVLMTNSLTIVTKVFSDTLIFLLLKCEYPLQCKSYSCFFRKNINLFAIFQDKNF